MMLPVLSNALSLIEAENDQPGGVIDSQRRRSVSDTLEYLVTLVVPFGKSS